METINRRSFLAQAAVTTAGMSAAAAYENETATTPNQTVVVGVMGTSRNSNGGDGRGAGLARTLASLPNCEVAYVCDVDNRNVGKAAESVMAQQRRKPVGVSDFRRILDDSTIDALVIAAPDHWHAPAAIAACSAGKHVYVEKPCSHNAQEGQWLVDAARKHKRLVQHGTQRRSWPGIKEAIHRLREGVVGNLASARAWYFNRRPTIGRGVRKPVPNWLDYELWQGPAPKLAYQDNVVHYNWHWFWHWGTAELGNNGVHTLDVCRWGLEVDYPMRITSGGGRHYFNDDQETPDTSVATFEFGSKSITWEGQSCGGRQPGVNPHFDIVFYGTKGVLGIRGGAYEVFDLHGKPVAKGSGNGGDQGHLANFVDAIRGEVQLNAEIGEGYKSTLLCHLGNIAYRSSGSIRFDPKQQKIVNDRAAEQFWGRDYNQQWSPKQWM